MRLPKPGDLYEVFFRMRGFDGGILVEDRWCQLVTACDVGPFRHVQVLVPDGSLHLVRQDDVHGGINDGSWKLISSGCSSGAL